MNDIDGRDEDVVFPSKGQIDQCFLGSQS